MWGKQQIWDSSGADTFINVVFLRLARHDQDDRALLNCQKSIDALAIGMARDGYHERSIGCQEWSP